MHARIGKVTQGMDFFIERQAAPADGRRGPQQLPAAVRGKVPVQSTTISGSGSVPTRQRASIIGAKSGAH